MAAEALTSLLVEKLATAAIDQVGRVLGVRNQLQKLKSELSTIQKVIHDAEVRSVKESLVQDWLDDLKDVAYDADDLLDEFQTYVEWRKQEATTMWQKVRFFFSPRSNPLAFRINMSRKIKPILENLDMIAKKRRDYHLREAPPCETRQNQMKPPTMTAPTSNETEVYGRDDDVKEILKLLLENKTDKEGLSVVTIHGMGGLGKTTLAQQVYKHEMVVKEKFDHRIWVCVSDPFDMKRIATTIIESIEGRCDLSQFETVVGHMREILANKRFFLVLDDVWTKNEQELDELKGFQAVGSKGSKILVTTRNFMVASMMGTPHPLGVLSEDDCWRLFEKRAFWTENVQRKPSLEPIGREIVAKGGGSPLAAKALGSLMRYKTEIRQWEAVRDNDIWRSTDEGGRVMASLRLSYNHLPPDLKQCFAYCSIFPKGTRINRDELVVHWIALGFIPSDTSSEFAVNKGNEYFDNLVWISFLDKYFAEYYKMHDLVHDLAEEVAGDRQFSFICYADDQKATNIPPRCRFCTLVGRWKESELKHLFREPSKVRALRLELKGSEISNTSILFTNLTCLRVLDMGGSAVKEVHASIKRLQHLRYFTFKGGLYLLELPNSIGRLRNLLVLNASSCNVLRSLPPSFTSLQNLQTLDLSQCHWLGSLPESLDNLQCLQTLKLSYCTRLRSLPESLVGLQGLQTLELEGCSNLGSLTESIGKLANLRTLNLAGCKVLNSLPQSLGDLSNLEELDLSKCKRIVELPESIGKLVNLRTLQLNSCEDLHSLPQSLGNLTNLEELDLNNCVGIVELPESIGRLAKLRTLPLNQCQALHSLPQSLGNLSNLEELDLWGCEDITELPEGMGNMANLRHLKNWGMFSLRGMPLGIDKMRSLVTLQLFVVGEDSNHSSIAEMHHLNLIEGELELSHLENVKRPGDAAKVNMKERHRLRNLCLRWSDAIPHDPYSIHEEVLADLIPHPNLEELEIESYPGINFPNWVRMMGDSVPNLVELRLSGLKCLPSFSGCLLQLKRLYLKNMSDVEKWLVVADGVELYPRLQMLKIESCPDLARIPEWLRELTSLENLTFWMCSNSLKERCKEDTGEDWPIIAHIRSINFYRSR